MGAMALGYGYMYGYARCLYDGPWLLRFVGARDACTWLWGWRRDGVRDKHQALLENVRCDPLGLLSQGRVKAWTPGREPSHAEAPPTRGAAGARLGAGPGAVGGNTSCHAYRGPLTVAVFSNLLGRFRLPWLHYRVASCPFKTQPANRRSRKPAAHPRSPTSSPPDSQPRTSPSHNNLDRVLRPHNHHHDTTTTRDALVPPASMKPRVEPLSPLAHLRRLDPRSSSTQSLTPSEPHSTTASFSSSTPPRRRLLLVYIHGFYGNNQSFKSFPAHVHAYLKDALAESHAIHTKIYPRYKTYHAVAVGAEIFSKWLEPHEDEETDVVLVGHSMGGILASDVVLMVSSGRSGRAPSVRSASCRGGSTTEGTYANINSQTRTPSSRTSTSTASSASSPWTRPSWASTRASSPPASRASSAATTPPPRRSRTSRIPRRPPRRTPYRTP